MSLVVNFNQLVDLAVNPSIGTINTSPLHNLLHIIINQLQLSTASVEFHGAGSAAIESHIVNNRHYCGNVQINEFEAVSEVDEATGNVITRRKEIESIKSNEVAKLFTIKNVETDSPMPMGFPVNPIQAISIDQLKASSIHDALANMIPSNDKLIEAENTEESLRAMFDYINASKRLDALEIGIRQLAEIVKGNQCNAETTQSKTQSEIDPMIKALQEKTDELTAEMEKFNCKSGEDRGEDGELESRLNNLHEKSSREFEESLSKLRSDVENLESDYQLRLKDVNDEIARFKELVCERLEAYKVDLVGAMTEVQELINTKVDKQSISDLKQHLQDMMRDIESKIDSKNPLAAGAVKKDKLTCVSCSKNVTQADLPNPNQSMLVRHVENHNAVDVKLFEVSTRLCGGSHTITTPKERIFRSENVKIECQDEIKR